MGLKAKNAVLIIVDGLGDRPIAQFNNLTPLEYARTPNLNAFADRGTTGLLDTIAPGVRAGSDTSHMAILGYDPKTQYTGRGPLEAAGTNIQLKSGDLALRLNFATSDSKGKLLDRRAGRVADASVFEKELNAIKLAGAKPIFKAGASHRGCLVLRPEKGVELSDKVTENDPHHAPAKRPKITPTENTAAARKTAELLNDYVKKADAALHKHAYNKQRLKEKLAPANTILLRGAGFAPSLEQFPNKYGLRAACVCGAAMYRGLAKLAGFETISVKGATGRADTDLHAKVQAVLKALSTNDFVFMHVKATDVYGHDGDAMGKRSFIERIDYALAPLLALQETLVVITADHSTSCEQQAHTGDPVPILLSGPGVRRDAIKKFGERDCARGDLGRLKGADVMPEVMNLLGKAKLYGA